MAKEVVLGGIADKSAVTKVKEDTQAGVVHISNLPASFPDPVASVKLTEIENDIVGFQSTNHTDLMAVKNAVENMNINMDDLTVIVADSAANNLEGEVSSLAVDASANIAQYAPTATYKLKGFCATCSADGLFRLKVNGVTKLVGRTNIVNINILMFLPDPIFVLVGSTIVLEVTNKGVGVGSFNGVIVGE